MLPGSKATLADLEDLRRNGWDIDLRAHVRRGGRVLGLCGGYQMLGRRWPIRMGSRGRRAVAGAGAAGCGDSADRREDAACAARRPAVERCRRRRRRFRLRDACRAHRGTRLRTAVPALRRRARPMARCRQTAASGRPMCTGCLPMTRSAPRSGLVRRGAGGSRYGSDGRACARRAGRSSGAAYRPRPRCSALPDEMSASSSSDCAAQAAW